VARWKALVAAAVVAGSIVLLGLAKLRAGVALAATPSWMLVPAALVLGAIFMHYGRERWLAFLGLKHVSTYPPLWLAGLAGATALTSLLGIVPTIRDSVGIPIEDSALLTRLALLGAVATGGVLLVAVCQFAWRARVRRSSTMETMDQNGHESTETRPLHGSFERLTSWLVVDAPIIHNEDDAFGHSRIAHRIASRLLEEDPPAQAIVGRLGAGKTTLCGLVVAALTGLGALARRVHVVPVELWPYETPRAAVEGVIRTLVDALSREVNVTALRGIPESYVNAMSSAGGVWSAIAHLQGAPRAHSRH